MRIRRDGSVQSSATPTHQNVAGKEDFGLYRCMVTRVNYTDDPVNFTSNSPAPRVLYDVVVLGGFHSGQIVSNCRLASDFGGNFNYYERTLRAASRDVSKTRLTDADGDIVYVQFLQGNPKFPVIIAADSGITPGSSTGARAADGQVLRSQYNGILTTIDKDGNARWTKKDGSYNSQLNAFVPASTSSVDVDVRPQKMTITMKNGMTVTLDGNTDSVRIQTKGGANLQVNGTTDQILAQTKAGAKADVTAGVVTLKDAGNGSLKITGNKVALGASSAELLQQISDQLQELITVFGAESSHTHVGNLGYPTAPPSTAGDLSGAASALGVIKGKVDGIKGTL